MLHCPWRRTQGQSPAEGVNLWRLSSVPGALQAVHVQDLWPAAYQVALGSVPTCMQYEPELQRSQGCR